jgi:hypothetical protein
MAYLSDFGGLPMGASKKQSSHFLQRRIAHNGRMGGDKEISYSESREIILSLSLTRTGLHHTSAIAKYQAKKRNVILLALNQRNMIPIRSTILILFIRTRYGGVTRPRFGWILTRPTHFNIDRQGTQETSAIYALSSCRLFAGRLNYGQNKNDRACKIVCVNTKNEVEIPKG